MKFIKLAILTLLMGIGIIASIQAQDWPNLKQFQEANATLSTPIDSEDRVVFMGNSITIGWLNKRPEFFAGKPYINRGISGQTTPQMLLRFRQDVIDIQPKVVVLLAGTNDIAGNTGPSTLAMIMDNIKSMAELAHANGIKVVLSSTLPAYEYRWKTEVKPAEIIVALNTLIKAYSEEAGHIYLDYFSAMVDERNGLPKKYTDDEVHPTTEGYMVMEPMVEEAISKALESKQ